MDGFEYKSHSSKTENSVNEIDLNIKILNEDINIKGAGSGPIDSFMNAINKKFNLSIKVSDYNQNAISSGADAKAAAFIELEYKNNTVWGAGINPNTTQASFEAIVVGLSKLLN